MNDCCDSIRFSGGSRHPAAAMKQPSLHLMFEAVFAQSPVRPVRTRTLTAFLSVSRMKDTNKKNNIFSQFRKNDRDKQKLIETVVKQLRSLVNGMSS